MRFVGIDGWSREHDSEFTPVGSSRGIIAHLPEFAGMSTPSKGQPAGTDFRPAHLHLPTLRIWYACLPLIMRRFCEVMDVEFPPDDLARLKAYKRARASGW